MLFFFVRFGYFFHQVHRLQTPSNWISPTKVSGHWHDICITFPLSTSSTSNHIFKMKTYNFLLLWPGVVHLICRQTIDLITLKLKPLKPQPHIQRGQYDNVALLILGLPLTNKKNEQQRFAMLITLRARYGTEEMINYILHQLLSYRNNNKKKCYNYLVRVTRHFNIDSALPLNAFSSLKVFLCVVWSFFFIIIFAEE